MQTSINKQYGLTFISLCLVLGLIGFFTLLILKIGPLYLNNSKVHSAVADVKNMPDVANKTKSEIKNSLLKRFDMNYVDHVSDQDITILAQPGYVKLDVQYERVEHLFGNLSVLVEFHEGFEVGSR